MKRISFFIVFCISMLGATSCVVYAQNALELIDGTVFKIPLKNYNIQTRVGNPTSNVYDETFSRGAIGGINGSFFCPAEPAYQRCGANGKTSSERIVDGIEYSASLDDTGIRGIFGITQSGRATLVQNNRGFMEGYNRNTNADKRSEILYGIGNFPILLDEGYDPLLMGGYTKYLDGKMTAPMTRNFICTTKEQDLVYMGFVRNKTLREMPGYLKEKYNCYHAINLDAGASSAMVYQNDYLLGPGRDVADGFIVTPKESWLEYQLSHYTLSPKEKHKAYILYKLFSSRRKQKDDLTKEDVVHILTLFEQSPSYRANVPLRKLLQQIITYIDEPYGFTGF